MHSRKASILKMSKFTHQRQHVSLLNAIDLVFNSMPHSKKNSENSFEVKVDLRCKLTEAKFPNTLLKLIF